MPVLAKFCGIVIRLLTLRPLGHRIHAFYRDEELVVDLDEVRVVAGHAPERIVRLVLAWARQHRGEILREIEAVRNNAARTRAVLV
jgi:hypothetical protein